MRRYSPAVTWLCALVVLTACSSSAANTSATSWATETSAQGGGGMDSLVAAAKAEGQLNVIALPRDWAHYAFLIDGFKSRYGIKVNELNPNAVSQEEIDTAKRAGKSKSAAPDVFDLNMTTAVANASLFSPYKVTSWDSIPSAQKESDGHWYQDYGGYMSIGEDTAKLPAVAKIEDLLQPAFKAKVAVKGDPTVDDTTLAAVVMVALNEGGSLDDIAPGVDFFHKLRKQGSFTPTHATDATVKAGQTPVVFDWEFQSLRHTTDISTWQVVVPGIQVLATYYAQAINRQAPHPAAARLWEEFLYSATGQNEWLRAGVRPVEMAALQTTGKIDPNAAQAMPQIEGTPAFMTPAQAAAARTYLAANWAKAIA